MHHTCMHEIPINYFCLKYFFECVCVCGGGGGRGEGERVDLGAGATSTSPKFDLYLLYKSGEFRGFNLILNE